MAADVRTRATRAILTSAVFSWQTALTALVTGILFVVNPLSVVGLPAWLWLIGGALAEAGFIAATLTDPNETGKFVREEFAQRFDLTKLRNPVYRERVQKAIEYRDNMTQLAARHGGAMRVGLEQTIDDVADWIAGMYSLAQNVESFEANKLIEDDRKAVNQRLAAAERRLKLEDDPSKPDRDERLVQDLGAQVRLLQQQSRTLNETASSVKRAEVQLDSTLASIGTVYAQMSLLGTKEVDSSSAQRLRLEIRDEIAELQDTIHALDEVQSQQLRLQ